jgi:hypothetical protein
VKGDDLSSAGVKSVEVWIRSDVLANFFELPLAEFHLSRTRLSDPVVTKDRAMTMPDMIVSDATRASRFA